MAENIVRRHDWGLLAIGTVFAGGGLYFVLCGTGLVPLPSDANGPIWLVAAAGLAFFAAGVSILVRAWLALPDHQSNLPADTPAIFVAIQWLAGLTIIASLASIATWIAFGAGTRHFSMSLSFDGGYAGRTIGEMIGRTAFGFSAVVIWLMFALMAYSGAEKILRRKR